MQKTFLLRMAIVLAAVFGLLVAESCSPPPKTEYHTCYVYENSTDRDISLEVYTMREDNKKTMRYSFTITAKNSYILELYEGKDLSPFISGSEWRYLFFTNGELGVTQHYPDKNNNYLFRQESYALVSDDNGNKTYKYTFTEKDFEKGVPVE